MMFSRVTSAALVLGITHLQGTWAQANCTTTNLNTTADDTIFSIASATNRGVCDIARANRMADAELLRANATLLIPGESCSQDNESCLLVAQNTTTDCIFGGPHTYTTVTNDTIAKVALEKFGIPAAALTTGPVNDILAAGMSIKVPQCSPSQCTVQPYRFTYGTYKDLAKQFNTTVGQIFALNPTYSYSSTLNESAAPVITMPMDCRPLSANYTVIS
ncbi:putative peptidoglycan-binding lysin subgroup protein [Diplogelasinospora grovesii]|uniref:Peptidoglycan-binding lysin subgroup protein n=1 Tax=Diplogelasinospora grovesii TaxID=303347 RepID=A0AAN6S302_9PEZI|nr:putative peptidoglycan-binding lysin subgroup protein [Diplogelasinospora grovesii]